MAAAVAIRTRRFAGAAFAVTLLATQCAFAAVLPEDRADALYHSYNGGGVKISGPSILVQKQLGKHTSVNANYYVDSVSSASIDVITTASAYSEQRIQKSAGVEWLEDDTTMTLSYTKSDENDYQANTAHGSFTQEFFGNMTTLTMAYEKGWDVVGKRNDPSYAKDNDRQNFSLGVSQVTTKNLLLNLNWEIIANQGFLNNPYRSARYLDSTAEKGYSYEPEIYPNTHTSNAVSLGAHYYLPYRAALHGQYRLYTDTWGIHASHYEIGYTHPWRKQWIFDIKYRFYQQTHADFYSDLFPYESAQNYLARDKELATFSSQDFGCKVTYEFASSPARFIKKSTINFAYDYIHYSYDDFRDLTQNTAAGAEGLYGFSANVLQFFLSIWY